MRGDLGAAAARPPSRSAPAAAPGVARAAASARRAAGRRTRGRAGLSTFGSTTVTGSPRARRARRGRGGTRACRSRSRAPPPTAPRTPPRARPRRLARLVLGGGRPRPRGRSRSSASSPRPSRAGRVVGVTRQADERHGAPANTPVQKSGRRRQCPRPQVVGPRADITKGGRPRGRAVTAERTPLLWMRRRSSSCRARRRRPLRLDCPPPSGALFRRAPIAGTAAPTATAVVLATASPSCLLTQIAAPHAGRHDLGHLTSFRVSPTQRRRPVARRLAADRRLRAPAAQRAARGGGQRHRLLPGRRRTPSTSPRGPARSPPWHRRGPRDPLDGGVAAAAPRDAAESPAASAADVHLAARQRPDHRRARDPPVDHARLADHRARAFLFGLLRSRLARHGLAELLLSMRTLRAMSCSALRGRSGISRCRSPTRRRCVTPAPAAPPRR